MALIAPLMLAWLLVADGGEDDPGDDDESGSGDDDEDEDEGTFKQGDLDRISKSSRRKGERAGQRQLAKDLGFDSIDDLRDHIENDDDGDDDDSDDDEDPKPKPKGKRRRSRQRDNRDDDDDRRSRRANRRRTRDVERIEAEQDLEIDVRADIVKAGIIGGRRGANMVTSAVLDELLSELDPNDVDPEDIEEAIEAVRTDAPQLFSDDSGRNGRRGSGSTRSGRGQRRRAKGGRSLEEQGKEEARKLGWTDDKGREIHDGGGRIGRAV